MVVSRRPPFTGIHEIPPKRGDPGVHEGGGDLPPFGEDIFQRVVDVNWAPGTGVGGRYAAGDLCCFMYYGTVFDKPTLNQNWIPLGAPIFGPSGDVVGGSCAMVGNTPVFLFCGDAEPDATHEQYGSCIVYSNDGISWVRVFDHVDFSDITTDNKGFVASIIWDRNVRAFYAHVIPRFSNSPEDQPSKFFKSGDGRRWLLVNGETYQSYIARSQFGYADGIVGYDAANDQLIIPDDVSTDVYPWFSCYCVAYLNGVWLAGGDGVADDNNHYRTLIKSSIDGGRTWYSVFGGDEFRVLSLLALPYSFL